VNRNELEDFQRNLLRKINSRLYPVNEQEESMMNSLDVITGSSINRPYANLEELDMLSSTSISHENQLNSLRLVRSRSNSSSFSGSGYLFLAIVFCMMCCSSLLIETPSFQNIATSTQGFQKAVMSGVLPPHQTSRKMMSSSDKKAPNQNLVDPVEEDMEMVPINEKPQASGPIQILQMMLSGHYVFYTYMVLSTTCFFFWMMPNCHKLKKLFVGASSKRRVNYRPSHASTRANQKQYAKH
jgi:hypothetical protein